MFQEGCAIKKTMKNHMDKKTRGKAHTKKKVKKNMKKKAVKPWLKKESPGAKLWQIKENREWGRGKSTGMENKKKEKKITSKNLARQRKAKRISKNRKKLKA